MPFPNEHAARQRDPDEFVESSFRSVSRGFPEGIRAIMGDLKSTGEFVIQSIRFNRLLWTPEEAIEWLKQHGFAADLEETTQKSFWSGIL